MGNRDMVIGVLGGMGTYATIDLFKKYASIFLAEKEWDRPRIIIDNNCTMPSRVRAFLYGENRELLINQMSESIRTLIHSGANRIILACNTSHLFLPEIYQLVPLAKKYIVNIIDITVNAIAINEINDVYLLASEGTIESNVYAKSLSSASIRCRFPEKEQYENLRTCIEAVKQNSYSEYVKNMFLSLINSNKRVILGCTELPILMHMYSENVTCEKVFDPIELTLKHLRKEYKGLL